MDNRCLRILIYIRPNKKIFLFGVTRPTHWERGRPIKISWTQGKIYFFSTGNWWKKIILKIFLTLCVKNGILYLKTKAVDRCRACGSNLKCFSIIFSPSKNKISEYNRINFRPTDPILEGACYPKQEYFFIWPYCTAESLSSVWHMELGSIRIALRVVLGVCIASTRARRLQDIGKNERSSFPLDSIGGCEINKLKIWIHCGFLTTVDSFW